MSDNKSNKNKTELKDNNHAGQSSDDKTFIRPLSELDENKTSHVVNATTPSDEFDETVLSPQHLKNSITSSQVSSEDDEQTRALTPEEKSSSQNLSEYEIDDDSETLVCAGSLYPPTIEPIVKAKASSSKGLPNTSAKKEQTTIHVGHVIRERFVIKKILGAGGMGAVYQALDLRKQEAGDNDPYIAIKVLSGDFKHHDDAFVTMQREAKKTNALAHPNIVTVYDFDRENDLIYLTMEQLKGYPLDEIIKGKAKRKIDEKLAYSIIDQIAKGLSYAHSKGIVHSDLKPANIFITDDDKVKILDFGIARAINEEIYEDNFDAGKLGALTLAYASLEMINYQDPHPSDDIYALGIIACELILKEHPYKRQNAKQVLEQGGRRPKLHIKNIFMRRCIANAIALKREERIANAGLFLRKYHRSRTAIRKIVITCAIVGLLFLVNTFYISTIDTQIVPFESLSETQQQQFHKYIAEGKTALMFNDLQGAVINFNEAYLLHKTHKDIKLAQKTVLSIINNNLEQAPEDKKEFILEQMKALEHYPAFKPENVELNK